MLLRITMYIDPDGRVCRLPPATCFPEDDVRPLAPSKGSLAARPRPPCDAGRKRGDMDQALRWKVLHEAPACPSRVRLGQVAQRQALVSVSVRQRKRWRVQWTRTRRQGRPRQAAGRPPVASGAEVAQGTPRLSGVGVPLLAQGLEPPAGFAPVVAGRQPA